VPTSSISDIRPLASRILLVQTGAGAAVALVCLLVWGRYACVSALAGGGTPAASGMAGPADRLCGDAGRVLVGADDSGAAHAG